MKRIISLTLIMILALSLFASCGKTAENEETQTENLTHHKILFTMENGETFPLNAANSTDSESFHNWSLNSRWILFTSRRDDGLYTQLYFAHVDNEGHVSKPFRLPQQNPKEHDAETIYSYNTPDFAKTPVNLQATDIYQRLLDSQRTQTTLK